MVKFLINRPIAVFLSFIGILFFSVLAIRQLPVSLLPNIEVPSVVIKADYPNTPSRIIENSVLRPIRSELNSLNNLKSIESTAGSETGLIRLEFNYGTRMDLAYIEINEKIDRLQETLPRGMDRPRIIRINTSDIPIIRLQLIPKSPSDFIEVSKLAERVLKKRIEQLSGVSIVDINGFRDEFIAIMPDRAKLQALTIPEEQIGQVLQSANQELGQLSIKDGQYRYFVRMANRLGNLEEIKNLPLINSKGDIVPLHRVATVAYQPEKVLGYHLFGKEEGLVITIHKQNSAKMTELVPLVYEAVEQFKKDYPKVSFHMTQDQSNLLNAGINNLKTSLVYGGIFAFAVLFLFMGNVRMPIIMGITLPVSLVISFLLFRAAGLSINIISLSGLALGLGMLIDNAIIVIDNITRKRKEGHSLIDACITGVNEVMAPLISSVLTTLAVFIPLVFLNGLSGALFYDQAVSVAIILGTSLMVAFVLLPLLYRMFFQHHKGTIKEDSFIFRGILKVYKLIYRALWRFRIVSFLLLLLLIPGCYWMVNFIDKKGLPEIEKTETLLQLSWNEPIDAATSMQRIKALLEEMNIEAITESDIGLKQFILSVDEGSIEQADIYFNFPSAEEKRQGELWLLNYLQTRHPQASITIQDAPNAFDQIFNKEGFYFTAKWKTLQNDELLDHSAYTELENEVNKLVETAPLQGKGFIYEDALEATINSQKLSAYGISENEVKNVLSKALDGYLVTEIRRFGEVIPVRVQRPKADLRSQLSQATVRGKMNQEYPLSEFVQLSFTSTEKNITADRTGVYQSMEWEELSEQDIQKLMNQLPEKAAESGLMLDFDGTYFEDLENLRQLVFVLLISVALLYFILAAQFESLVQPMIVIFTLPLGILGALLILQFSGGSLNVMSAIGIIVMLGIMVNDAILKIDTINRLVRQIDKTHRSAYKEQLAMAIAKTGEIRLKPILMTSITTILALLPVVFSSGIGADLQRPLVFAVIGGLTIGTFTALFFVPLAYWFISKKKA
ncbi:efflux RND transporter permease subunit [Roseivirga thermotolerans]|uniref:Cation transporter n=1 Tax=Roseivirga thermotolerans TaxID=1758176 RepID=A0ABQ3I4V0_9BACT|nr:efflux RND transporter permease subunit [Roseivirga thermotolerans]GHE64117.1 cation transporter [Roseivirga thermotolerans]